MNKQVAVAGVIAVLIVGVVVSSILISTRKHRVELHGSVLKVRSHPVDAESTVVVADIRVTNPSTQQFVVYEVDVFLDDAGGESVAGDVFSSVDTDRLLQYYPVLGQKYNPNLMIRQQVNSGESIDRMIAVRFPGSEDRVEKRKGLRIVVTDVDGAKTEIAERL